MIAEPGNVAEHRFLIQISTSSLRTCHFFKTGGVAARLTDGVALISELADKENL